MRSGIEPTTRWETGGRLSTASADILTAAWGRPGKDDPAKAQPDPDHWICGVIRCRDDAESLCLGLSCYAVVSDWYSVLFKGCVILQL